MDDPKGGATSARELIAAGRRHDEEMTSGPWRGEFCLYSDGYQEREVIAAQFRSDADGVSWMRTNLRAMLDGYTTALDSAERWEAAAMRLRTEASAVLDSGTEYHRRHLAALAECDQLRTENARLRSSADRLQLLLTAARQLALNWRDTSGSMTRIDAINEGCEAVVRAAEGLDRMSKEGL